ncbi:MAG: nitrous oxide reductase accessory protein NosL [Paracoccus sp. (in: a-proteobacteria)]|nr:nitrous oxide reductase accessory protein NosL [Paracoccus sp. (in: a-proteobacteria)]
MRYVAALALLALAACRQEEAAIPGPVPMTADAVGHFCQMNVLEHPGPKAQIHLRDVQQPLFFSQARDAIAFQLMPEQQYETVAVYVTDMGHADWDAPGNDHWIAQDDAVYVVGSAREGGMGAPETVPFGSEDEARAFIEAYGGELRQLSQIAPEEVLAPAGPLTDGAEDDGADDDYADRLRRLGRTPEVTE